MYESVYICLEHNQILFMLEINNVVISINTLSFALVENINFSICTTVCIVILLVRNPCVHRLN